MDPARFRIVLIVLAGHLSMIGVMVAFGVGSFTPPAPQPIQVQLVRPSAPSMTPVIPPSRTRSPAVPRATVSAPETSSPPSLSVPNDSVSTNPAPSVVAPAVRPPEALAPPSGGSAAGNGPDRGPTVDASFQGNRLPDYPAMSRRLGEQGVVVLRVFITPDGRASDVALVKSSGSTRLDRSAMDAVRQWRFVPARQAGQPVGAWYEWRWEFRLDG
jgi:periplasmic protein TonB